MYKVIVIIICTIQLGIYPFTISPYQAGVTWCEVRYAKYATHAFSPQSAKSLIRITPEATSPAL